MASALNDRKSYPVFVFDSRFSIDGFKFGVFGKFVMIAFVPREYLKHLNCAMIVDYVMKTIFME